MIDKNKIPKSLREVSRSEYERFHDFLDSHAGKTISVNGESIFYCICGEGPKTVLTFAGGLVPFEMLYDFILGFEKNNRVVVVDISAYDDPEQMCRGITAVLDTENIQQAIVFGQSFSGIIAQAYFKRSFKRVQGMVLTNTIAPKKEKCKKWVLRLFMLLPMPLLKPIIKKKLTPLSRFDMDVPTEVKERRQFVMTLVWQIMDTYFTKQKLANLLKLSYTFNEKDGYSLDDYSGWNGKVLNITSEDDPYYKDVDFLMTHLPNTELFKLPSGFGHMAPQIHRDEFHEIIQSFIDRLLPSE